jgi:hypothetical protein
MNHIRVTGSLSYQGKVAEISVTSIFTICALQQLGISLKQTNQENVARMRGTTNAYKILVGKPEGRKPLGRSIGVDRKIILKHI